jgi:hypothetical protein
MTITDDYKIFADKYHNKQHLPDDIIKYIMKINTEAIQQEIVVEIQHYRDLTDKAIDENQWFLARCYKEIREHLVLTHKNLENNIT